MLLFIHYHQGSDCWEIHSHTLYLFHVLCIFIKYATLLPWITMFWDSNNYFTIICGCHHLSHSSFQCLCLTTLILYSEKWGSLRFCVPTPPWSFSFLSVYICYCQLCTVVSSLRHNNFINICCTTNIYFSGWGLLSFQPFSVIVQSVHSMIIGEMDLKMVGKPNNLIQSKSTTAVQCNGIIRKAQEKEQETAELQQLKIICQRLLANCENVWM